MKMGRTIIAIFNIALVVFSTAFQSQDKANIAPNNDELLASVTAQVTELKSTNIEVNNDIAVLKTSNAELDALVHEFESDTQIIEKQLETAKERQTIAERKAKFHGIDVPKLEPSSDWTNFTATFYNAGAASTGKQPGDKQYGITRSGRPVTPGVTVSVDPRIIPLGTMIEIMFPDGHIESRRADDTGSAIRGHKIDIFSPLSNSKLLELGVQNVQVRILS